MNKENDAPKGIEKEAEENKIFQQMRIRFPGQVHGKKFTTDEECNLLTWVNVFEFAKCGRFDCIRPDILVNNFANLLEIQRYYQVESTSQIAAEEESVIMEGDEEVINK